MTYREATEASHLSTPPATPVTWIVWELKRPTNETEVTAQLAAEACALAILFDENGVSLHASQMKAKQKGVGT